MAVRVKKKKVYVLMISRTFPATHPRKGELTNFAPKILSVCGVNIPYQAAGQNLILDTKAYYADYCFTQGFDPKIHTIRGNYDLWKKRADKINAGEAVLSLRQWSGSPYNYAQDGSKQVEFMQLEKINVQKIEFNKFLGAFIDDTDSDVRLETLAKNDGLSVEDFKAWFHDLKYDEPYAIINFTDHKY